MKPYLFILLSTIFCISFAGCKKSNKSITPALTPAADPVDTIIGTYSGSMHVVIVSSHFRSPIPTSDVSSLQVFVFSKVSADSFSSGGLVAAIATKNLKYNPSGIYINDVSGQGGFFDTLNIIPPDSIHYVYHDMLLIDGGYTYTAITTKTFSGKK